MTLLLKLDGVEIARITGEGIVHGRRTDPAKGLMSTEMIDDPLVYVMRKYGKTLWVLNLSASPRMTCEEIP